MFNVTLAEDSRYYAKSLSDGEQLKYLHDGYYYKCNNKGNEAITEFLISLLLEYSTLPEDAYVEYELGYLNGRIACRSQSFLSKDEEFVTMQSMYYRLYGKQNLADELLLLREPNERLEFILKIAVAYGIDKDSYTEYMNRMLQLDMLTLNSDRHVRNYGAICKGGVYKVAPIFDNAQSLLTDGQTEPTPCTLAGSFEAQVVTFGYPIKPAFTVNYKRLYSKLQGLNYLEVGVLKQQLKKYERLFRKDESIEDVIARITK